MGDLPPNQIICGDCREVMAGLLVDSIDLVVTSPPYWGLRNYGLDTMRIWGGDPACEHEWGKELFNQKRGSHGDKSTLQGGIITQQHQGVGFIQGCYCLRCGAWSGSLGLEPHPQMFIDHLVEICREIKRVLKPSGTFWINLGDTYCNTGKWVNKKVNTDFKQGRSVEGGEIDAYSIRGKIKADGAWIQSKQLLMIPARVAIALQNDGWILRNDIIWYKRNAMPTSAKDRLKCSHEHIFFLAKRRHYYFNLDAIRKPYSQGTLLRVLQKNVFKQKGGPKQDMLRGSTTTGNQWLSNLGRYDPAILAAAERKRVNNQGKSNLMMQGLASKIRDEGKMATILDDKTTANSPHIRMENRTEADLYTPEGATPGDVWDVPTHGYSGAHFAVYPEELIEPIIKAACPPDGIVLDPFAGSGTTLKVAHRLGRGFIGIEINPEYAAMCERRLRADTYQPPPEKVQPLTEIFENE